MVGSADFLRRHHRRPGKRDHAASGSPAPPSSPSPTWPPWNWLVALHHVMDVSQEFPDGANPPYVPTNYDGKEGADFFWRTRPLGSSRNIPAVYHPLPDRAARPAGRGGPAPGNYHPLTPLRLRLSLTLGGGEVTLLELTGALRRPGQRRAAGNAPRYPAHRWTSRAKCYRAMSPWNKPQVVDSRIAYLLTDILSDGEAREAGLWREQRPATALPGRRQDGHTPTTIANNWAVGYTPDLVVGVWWATTTTAHGRGLSGARSAAPIWHDFMVARPGGYRAAELRPAEGIVRSGVCAVSGRNTPAICPDQARTDLFWRRTCPPIARCTSSVRVDRASGKAGHGLLPARISRSGWYTTLAPNGTIGPAPKDKPYRRVRSADCTPRRTSSDPGPCQSRPKASSR
jgi:membrane carboxypeptidase/penicillin-binding protein